MNTNTNIDTDKKLQNRTALTIKTKPEVSKYIVIEQDGREQVVAFEFNTKHVDMFSTIQRERPSVKAISAGFFLADNGALWAGGQSDTLNLVSREQDHELIKHHLANTDGQQFRI